MALNVKKGDTVQIISGKDRGATGRVLSVDIKNERVIVEGINRVKRHTKMSQTTRGGTSGGIETKEAPVHVSNVMVVDPKDNRGTRVAKRREKVTKTRTDGTTYESTRAIRVARRSGKEL
jgi:large subunit ribosomal protein L24